MPQYAGSEIMFVFPLNLGHSQQTIDELRVTAGTSIARGCFVFDDIFTLEFSGAIHGDQPTAKVTQNSEYASDDSGWDFSLSVWSGAEAPEHFTNELSMMPLLAFNRFDSYALFRVGN